MGQFDIREARFGRRRSRFDRNVIAELSAYVAIAPGDGYQDLARDDGDLYEIAAARRRRLEAGLSDSVAEHLGPEFSAEIRQINRGSAEVVAAILLVSSIVGSYNTVREGLSNVREDWKVLVRHVLDPFTPHELDVEAFFRLGPAMERLPVGSGLAPAASSALGAERRPLRLPGWALTAAASLLFLVLLGWLVVPLLLLADVF